MDRLSNLPNELLHEVVKLAMPESIDSFAFTSRRVLAVAWPFIDKYWELRRRYKAFDNIGKAAFNGRRLDTRCIEDPITTNITPSKDLSTLLTEVLKDPSVAYFIREFRLHGWWESWQATHPPFEYAHVSYTQEQLSLFRRALSVYVRPEKLGQWIQDVESGDEDPVLSLLLILLPNINSIKFEQCDDMDNRLMEVVKRIRTDCTADVTVLERLEKINLLYFDYSVDHEHSSDLLAFLATIPSLKCLYSQHMELVCDYQSLRNLSPRSSNITDLAFKNCGLSPGEIGGLLQGIKALQKFTYIDSEYEPEELAPSWVPAPICKLLLEHARQSLEVLDFRGEIGRKAHIDGLQDFESLKELTLSCSLFRRGASTVSESLMSRLPRCIQRMTLVGIEEEDISFLNDVTDALFDKSDRWPALKQICLHASWDLSARVVNPHKLNTRCSDAGLALWIKRKN